MNQVSGQDVPKEFPKDVEVLSGEPFLRLIFAVNLYVATGDYLGTANLSELPDSDEEFLMIILRNTQDIVDTSDFNKFAGRLDEIVAEGKIRVRWELRGMKDPSKFEVNALRINRADVLKLSNALLDRPSSLGWGSQYSLVMKAYDFDKTRGN